MRIEGIQENRAGLLLRLFYRSVRDSMRKLAGKAVLAPSLTLAAHQPRLLIGQTLMEVTHGGMSSVAPKLKTLASLAASTQIGCPF